MRTQRKGLPDGWYGHPNPSVVFVAGSQGTKSERENGVEEAKLNNCRPQALKKHFVPYEPNDVPGIGTSIHEHAYAFVRGCTRHRRWLFANLCPHHYDGPGEMTTERSKCIELGVSKLARYMKTARKNTLFVWADLDPNFRQGPFVANGKSPARLMSTTKPIRWVGTRHEFARIGAPGIARWNGRWLVFPPYNLNARGSFASRRKGARVPAALFRPSNAAKKLFKKKGCQFWFDFGRIVSQTIRTEMERA